MEKTVSEAIKYRRSVRRFDKDIEIDDNIVKKCIENAVLAPTSSNLQLWEFYHITDKTLLEEIAKSCFNQPAARTAKQLVITVVRRDLWRERAKENIKFHESNKESMSEREYRLVMKYYKTAIPLAYKNFLGISSYIKYINDLGKTQYVNTVGQKWSVFQFMNFKSASQPYYVAMKPTGEILTEPIQYASETKFKDWLDLSIIESSK